VFLRNVEHRLMYVEDAQTQDLPKQESTQRCIAMAMGFANWADFMKVLDQHRDVVQTQFDQVFSVVGSKKADDIDTPDNTLRIAQSIWEGALTQAESITKLEELGFGEALDTFRHIQHLQEGPKYKQLSELSRQRFNQLLPLLITVASRDVNPD